MKKQLQNKTVYEPNKSVKLTVVNKPIIQEETGEMLGYKVDITLKHTTSMRDAELKFATDDDIADFMNNIDYADPQQGLPFNQ